MVIKSSMSEVMAVRSLCCVGECVILYTIGRDRMWGENEREWAAGGCICDIELLVDCENAKWEGV